MKYYKQYLGDEKPTEVSRAEALRTLLTTYQDNDITRGLLEEDGVVRCLFSFIVIKNESEVRA